MIMKRTIRLTESDLHRIIKECVNHVLTESTDMSDIDTNEELEFVVNYCKNQGVDACVCQAFEKGYVGAKTLAKLVENQCQKQNDCHSLYGAEISAKEKLEKIAKQVYGAGKVVYSKIAEEKLAEIENSKYKDLPVVIAKTQYSFSDDPKLLGAPDNFIMNCREVRLCAGAGFIVLICGKIMTMPGLPKVPAAEGIDVDNEGKIIGLF